MEKRRGGVFSRRRLQNKLEENEHKEAKSASAWWLFLYVRSYDLGVGSNKEFLKYHFFSHHFFIIFLCLENLAA